MADTSPTTGEFFKAKTVTDDEIVAAIDDFMRDSTVSMFRFASGHSFDPAAAVKGHAWAKATVTHPDATDPLKHAVVQTAILLARAMMLKGLIFSLESIYKGKLIGRIKDFRHVRYKDKSRRQ